jgi:hypothetical protein
MRHKETEHEKIANELLNKLIPMGTLNSYYLFGYAQALVDINGVIEKDLKEDIFLITELINSILEQNEETKMYYERLTNN